jgi:hypothetical protein
MGSGASVAASCEEIRQQVAALEQASDAHAKTVQVERIDGAETPADLATATSATGTKSALGDAATHPTRASAAADEDEDGASSSVLAMATSLFNEFDQNGNGALDAFEFQTVASRFGKIMTTREAAEVMKSIDTDRNVKKLLLALNFKKYCQLLF